MLPLQKFWQAIESVPGAAAVSGEWRSRLGTDYPLIQSMLLLTDEIAATLRMPDDPYTEYQVVRHGPSDFVGVRDGGGPTIQLSKVDVLVYRLNHQRVIREVASALGFETANERIDGVPYTFRIGTLQPLAGFSFPVFVTFPLEPADLLHAVEIMSLQGDTPFIVLAPTSRLRRSACESLLTKRRACFLPLNEAIELGPDGKWCATNGAKQRLFAFQTAVVPQLSETDGTVFFPTPPTATWSDLHIKFVDGETVSVKIGDVAATFVYSQMGMADGRNAKPTKQWELLRTFAAGFGILTWKSSGASRDNQKRKEILVRDLKAFFRLDGEPIVYVETTKGWRTAFKIEPDA